MSSRKKNSILFPILAGLFAVGVAGAASASSGGSEGGGGDNTEPSPPPRPPNPPVSVPSTQAELRLLGAYVCRCAEEREIAGLEVDAATLRFCVASGLYGALAWPPIAQDPESVREVWDLIREYVLAFLDNPAAFRADYCTFTATPSPTPPPAPSPTFPQGGVDFEEASNGRPGYPWEEPLIHLGNDGKHFPTPGMFFVVRAPNAPTDAFLALDSLLGIARAAVASAYAMGGAARTLGSIDDELVLEYLRLMLCSPWNDILFGSTSSQFAGGSLGLGPHGRGSVMLPRHRRNLQRMAVGEDAVRSITLAGNPDPQIPDDNKWPEFWLPPIDLDALVNAGIVTTSGWSWSNGDSVLVPPPQVWTRGVLSSVEPAGGWGC